MPCRCIEVRDGLALIKKVPTHTPFRDKPKYQYAMDYRKTEAVQHEDVWRSILSIWSTITTPVTGYATLRAIIEATGEHPEEIAEMLKYMHIQHPDKIRFNVDRWGNLVYVYIDKSLLKGEDMGDYENNSYGQKKSKTFWRIIKRLGVTDEHGNELCLEVKRVGTTLYLSQMPCPKEFLAAQPPPTRPLRPISLKMSEELAKIQEEAVELFKKGMVDEAVELVRKFKLPLVEF